MRTIITIATIILFSLMATAQPTLDITLANTGGNTYEVRVRPDQNFDGLFSSLVFTLRWSAVDGISATDMSAPPDAAIGIAPAGSEINEEGFIYRVYTGFGFTPMFDFGQQWLASEEYTLLTITFDGPGLVQLVNDDRTAAQNGDFYASLNGYDRTGAIYESLSTAVSEEHAVQADGIRAWPVPAGDVVYFNSSDNGFIALAELVDATGRVVRKESAINGVGAIPVSGLPQGSYLLRAITAKGTMERNIIVQ